MNDMFDNDQVYPILDENNPLISEDDEVIPEPNANTRLLDQRAGVVIDLSGLPVEPADSSWCDEVGSEVS